MTAPSSKRLSLAFLILAVQACSDPQCPPGFDQMGNVCRRQDAGSLDMTDSAVVADGGHDDSGSVPGDAGSVGDAGTGHVPADPNTSAPTDAGPGQGIDATTAADSAVSDAQPPLDAGNDDSSVSPPLGECDNNRSCGAGYSCVNAKCVSACEQTKCDPNATCAIRNGVAACSCNSGYIAQGSTANPSCVRDVACSELNCHANAMCEVGTDQLRHCVCKTGYTGNGMTCAAVTCQPLTIQNGTVSGGMTYNETATYKCNTGYEFDAFVGSSTRKCGADGSWTGSAPRCNRVSCGTPPAVAHATVTPTGAGTYESQASYACATGYVAAGGASSTKITCGANKQWSTPPTCNSLCGNGSVDVGEECEREAPSDKWRCSSECKRLTIYTGCWSDAACDTSKGEVCHNAICTKSCSASSSCPATPTGTTPHCMAGWNVCVAAGCSSSADCHPGLICMEGMCYSCPGEVNGACGPNENIACLDATRNFASLGSFGHCSGVVSP